MNTNTVKILTLIFLLLVAISTYPWWHTLLPFINQTADPLHLSSLKAESIQQFSLTRPDANVTLTKTASGWLVNNFPANQETVNSFLASLTSLSNPLLVSKNPGNQSNFGLDDAHAYSLVLTGTNQQQIHFNLGQVGPTPNSFYLRLPNQPQVYLVTGETLGYAAKPINDWRDKRLFSLTSDQISQVTLATPKYPYTLTKSGDTWDLQGFPGHPNLEASPAASLLSALTNLEAADFLTIDQIKVYPQLKPVSKLSITAGSNIYNLEFRAKDSNYYAHLFQPDIYYLLSSSAIDSLFLTPDKL